MQGQQLNQDSAIRYAYIKNGNVIGQLLTINESPNQVPNGGPNAFLAEFLVNVGNQPLLLISNHLRNSHQRINNIEARVFRAKSSFHPYGTALVRMPAFFKILFRLIKFKPDRILCGCLGFPLWACYLYARLFSLPLVHSLHNRIVYHDSSWSKRLLAELDKFMLRRIQRVVCHGPFLRQQLLDIGVENNKIAEFDCGFRDMWSEPEQPAAIADLSGGGEWKVITYLGRMDYSKGVSDLLESCAARLVTDSAIRLVYIGDGADLAHLKTLAAQKLLQDKVIFLGLLAHDKLAAVIRQSHVLVTPTRSTFPEGRCMATMEGLAMKIPVIAPNFGPFPYLVQHGVNGLLFTPDSIDDLSAKINTALDDLDLYNRLKQGAHETSQRLLDPPLTFYKAVHWAFNAAGPSAMQGSVTT